MFMLPALIQSCLFWAIHATLVSSPFCIPWHLETILDQGWAFYWGTSEWSAEQITRAHAVATQLGLQGPLMEQPLYNLFNRDRVEREYESLHLECHADSCQFINADCNRLQPYNTINTIRVVERA